MIKETTKFQLVVNYKKDRIVVDHLNSIQWSLESEDSRNI